MKLSSINESSRRDFLKSMVSLAMSINGITKDAAINLAKQAVIGKEFQLRATYSAYDFPELTLEQELLIFKKLYNTLANLLKGNEQMFLLPAGDELEIIVDLKAEDALRIAKSYGAEFKVDEDGWYWINTPDFSIADDDPNNPYLSYVNISNQPNAELLNSSNLLKIWWEKYAKYSTYPYMSEQFANLLRRYGLDPYRPLIKEILGEEGYNTADAREKHTGSSEPERWEKPKYDKYDDYLMSQMAHESGIGESRINRNMI